MVTLSITASDGAALHVAIQVDYQNELDFKKALEAAIPSLLTKGVGTVHINTTNFKIGVAKVQQCSMKERSELYNKTGN